MKCVYCSAKVTEVTNSRSAKRGKAVWRRRYCTSCGEKFTSIERGGIENFFVIKSSGRRQRFIYEKLFASVFATLMNMKHHDNGNDALFSKRITEAVVEKILCSPHRKEISTRDIIVLMYTELLSRDPALAEQYIYYSAYRRSVGVRAGFISTR